jgi:glycosyltransferase involved in cell wall biosynthesis
MSLSVIIITKNEEAVIGRCVESVGWADEVIVLDSGSEDRTVEICRELGAQIHQAPDWPGFGPQKNRALALATSDWVFSIDADEWVTPELRAEIQRAIAEQGTNAAFRLPRSSSFCGRIMRHSGWSPDHVVRLFRRGTARFSDDLVHERLLVEGEAADLRVPLMHEAIRDLDQMLAKMNAYSTASSTAMHQRGKNGSVVSALAHGLWAFIRTYVLRAGFLDGREGLILAVANAEGAYYRYLKLMLLGKKNR